MKTKQQSTGQNYLSIELSSEMELFICVFRRKYTS